MATFEMFVCLQPLGQSQHRREDENAPASELVDLEAAIAPFKELVGKPEGARIRCFLQQALDWQTACQVSKEALIGGQGVTERFAVTA